MTENKEQKKGLKSPKAWIKLAITIVLSALVVISQAIATTFAFRLKIPPLFMTAVGEAIPLTLGIILMIVLGGKEWLRINKGSVRYAFKEGWPFLILGVFASASVVIRSIRNGTPLAQGFLVNLIGVILTTFLIGFFEEVLYRGLTFGSLLNVFGGSRVLIMCVVLFSAWTFGRVHVPSMSLENTSIFLQSLLKVIQTAMFGITLCEIVLHMNNLGGATLLHASNDFLLMFTDAIFEGKTATGEYTTSDTEAGKLVIIVYLIMIAVNLYPTIRSIIKIWKEYSECYGPFAD